METLLEISMTLLLLSFSALTILVCILVYKQLKDK